MDGRGTGRRAGGCIQTAGETRPGRLPGSLIPIPHPDPPPRSSRVLPVPGSPRAAARAAPRPVMHRGRGPGARWRRSVREAAAAAGPRRRRTRIIRTARTTRRTSGRRGRSPAASAIAWAWRASCAAAAGGRGRPGPVGGGGTWRQRGAPRARAGTDGERRGLTLLRLQAPCSGTPEMRAVLAWAYVRVWFG